MSTGVEPDAIAESKSTAWRAQQADALVAVVKAYLQGGNGEARATADHYQVVVHVDDKALRGGVGRADLPIDTVSRLTCDGSVISLVEDAQGNPLDVGRKQRMVSTPLKRALLSRDRGCSFPGCHRKHYLDAHHLRHWAHGGETSLDNLTLLCTHHHRMLHEGGFSVEREPDGTLHFERSDGRTIPRGGYQLYDFTDDVAENPSAEVREPAAVYLVAATAARPCRTLRASGRRLDAAKSS